jgi:hypothetical protein
MFWNRKEDIKETRTQAKENSSVTQTRGFTAKLKLPKYIPKDRILGRYVFDFDLERIGKAVDWTYTPEGQVVLIVSGKGVEGRLGAEDIHVPFEYIERASKIILLSKSIDELLPGNDIMTSQERRAKLIAALEKEFGEDE